MNWKENKEFYKGIGGIFLSLCCFVGLIYFFFFSSESVTGSKRADKLIFAGKIVNSRNHEWPNDRLVLIFLNGSEVGRGSTSLSEYPSSTQRLSFSSGNFSSNGMNDGVFQIAIDNNYGLNVNIFRKEQDLPVKFFSGKATDNTLFNRTTDPNVDYKFFGTWLGELDEGTILRIPIKEKNIEYTIKVVEGDLSTLPQELLTSGSTSLEDDGSIVVSLQDTPVSASTLESNENIDIKSVDYATRAENIELNKETIAINNCGGNNRVSQNYSLSQTYIREYQLDAEASLGVEIPLPLWLRLIPELSLQYGFQQGQIDTKTVEYEMAAEAETSVVYTISWQEVWESGQAEVVSGDDLIIVPFRVKADMIYALDSESIPCN